MIMSRVQELKLLDFNNLVIYNATMALERIGQLFNDYVKEPLKRRNSPEGIFKRTFGIEHTDPKAQEKVLKTIKTLSKLPEQTWDDVFSNTPDVGWTPRAVAIMRLQSARDLANKFGFKITRPVEEIRTQA